MPKKAGATFRALLDEDSETKLTFDNDSQVVEMLTDLGAKFDNGSSKAKANARAELLAGYNWVTLHGEDLGLQMSRAPEARWRSLSEALNLDFDKFSVLPEWPSILCRRAFIWAHGDQGPPKRKLPSGASGQIQKPGGGSAGASDGGGGSGGKSRKSGSKGADSGKANRSSSDDSSDTSPHGGGSPVVPPSTLAPMPSILGHDAAFDSLVDAVCALPWLATERLKAEIPSLLWPILWKGVVWNSRTRKDYDSMIKAQSKPGSFSSRTEDCALPGAIFRLALVYDGDAGLLDSARILAWLVVAEKSADFTGVGLSRHGGATGRSAFTEHRKQLASSWSAVELDIGAGQAVSGVSSTTFAENLYQVLDRRYSRFQDQLPAGVVREEVLANCARQCREVRAYMADFLADISSRASLLDHGKRPFFIGNRFLTLFKPAMTVLLDAAAGAIPGGIAPVTITPPDDDGAGGASSGSLTSRAKDTPPVASPSQWPFATHVGFSPAQLFGGGYYGQAPWPAYPPLPAYQPPPSPSSPTLFAQTPAPTASALPPAVHPGTQTSTTGPPGIQLKLEPDLFVAQPQHFWVTGRDSYVIPEGRHERPLCRCPISSAAPGTSAHATWDCPIRYWRKYNLCPGFFSNGAKDPAQWVGDCLSSNAKAAWRDLIKQKVIPLHRGPSARPTPF